MTVRKLIDYLSAFPDNADVVVVNENTLTKSAISFMTWKNSCERVNIYYKDSNNT